MRKGYGIVVQCARISECVCYHSICYIPRLYVEHKVPSIRYQVIVKNVPIITTEAILYYGQIASSRSVQNCTSRFESRLGQLFLSLQVDINFFHCKLDLVKDDQHQYSLLKHYEHSKQQILSLKL